MPMTHLHAPSRTRLLPSRALSRWKSDPVSNLPNTPRGLDASAPPATAAARAGRSAGMVWSAPRGPGEGPPALLTWTPPLTAALRLSYARAQHLHALDGFPRQVHPLRLCAPCERGCSRLDKGQQWPRLHKAWEAAAAPRARGRECSRRFSRQPASGPGVSCSRPGCARRGVRG